MGHNMINKQTCSEISLEKNKYEAEGEEKEQKNKEQEENEHPKGDQR